MTYEESRKYPGESKIIYPQCVAKLKKSFHYLPVHHDIVSIYLVIAGFLNFTETFLVKKKKIQVIMEMEMF